MNFSNSPRYKQRSTMTHSDTLGRCACSRKWPNQRTGIYMYHSRGILSAVPKFIRRPKPLKRSREERRLCPSISSRSACEWVRQRVTVSRFAFLWPRRIFGWQMAAHACTSENVSSCGTGAERVWWFHASNDDDDENRQGFPFAFVPYVE